MDDFSQYLKDTAKLVDQTLNKILPNEKTKPETIHKAMRYSVFAGGKKLRPILSLATAAACGGTIENAMPAACAVELMHTYSLVHDDLPCMDDDDLRRGRLTCHKVFGEGIAVLCGDALLTESFLVISTIKKTSRYDGIDFIKELAETGGSRFLIGGQIMDLESEGKKLTKSQLISIHKSKTAALIATSIRLGAMSANVTLPKLENLTIFGQSLGLAFQIIDDILDITQSSTILGKTAGKDIANEKATFPSIIGLEKSRDEATKLTQIALDSLKPLGKKSYRLQQITEYLLLRNY
jgi:geranylgeranyl diphosphate synthase, type II